MDSENDHRGLTATPVTCPCQLCNPSWSCNPSQVRGDAVTVGCGDDDDTTARVPRTDTVLILNWIVGTSRAAA